MKYMKISFEALNAYVDGELNAANTAEVAVAISQDPQLANQVALLTKLRSAVIETAEMPEIDLNQTPARRSRLAPGLLVASISFLVFVFSSILLSSSFDHPALPRWYAATANALENWPASINSNTPFIEATVPTGLLAGAYVPDLSAAKLIINHVEEKTVPVLGDIKVIGYRGTRGCRVILAIFSDGNALPDKKAFLQYGSTLTYGWRAGRLGYAFIADGMDTERFHLIAKTVHETTLRHLPINTETRMALVQSRQSSAPCQA